MLCGVDSGVCSTGQGGCCCGRKGCRCSEGYEVIRYQGSGAAGFRDGLAVHNHAVKIGHDVDLCRVVDVGDHGDHDVVSVCATIFRGDSHSADGCAGLCAATVYAIDQKGLRAFQCFANKKNVRVGRIVAENFQAGRVEVGCGHSEDLVVRSPVKFKGKGGDATASHFGVGSHAYEVNVSARKNFVLYCESTTTNRHRLHLPFKKFSHKLDCLFPCVLLAVFQDRRHGVPGKTQRFGFDQLFFAESRFRLANGISLFLCCHYSITSDLIVLSWSR